MDFLKSSEVESSFVSFIPRFVKNFALVNKKFDDLKCWHLSFLIRDE